MDDGDHPCGHHWDGTRDGNYIKIKPFPCLIIKANISIVTKMGVQKDEDFFNVSLGYS